MQKIATNFFTPIQEFALTFNLGKPPHWTWRKYLKTLGRHAEINESITGQLIEQGEKSRFDNTAPDNTVLDSWLESLKKYLELEADKNEVDLFSLRQDFSSLTKPLAMYKVPSEPAENMDSVDTGTHRSIDSSQNGSTQSTEPLSEASKIKENIHQSNASKDKPIVTKRNAALSIKAIIPLVILWTIFSVGLGIYFKHEIITSLPLHLRSMFLKDQEYSQFRAAKKLTHLDNEGQLLVGNVSDQGIINWHSFSRLASSYGLYGEATLGYRRILSMRPNDIRALCNLASIHLHASKTYVVDNYEAYRLLARARNIETKDGGSLSFQVAYTSAACEAQLGEYEQAVVYMQQAIDIYVQSEKGRGLSRRSRRRLRALHNELEELKVKADKPKESA